MAITLGQVNVHSRCSGLYDLVSGFHYFQIARVQLQCFMQHLHMGAWHDSRRVRSQSARPALESPLGRGITPGQVHVLEHSRCSGLRLSVKVLLINIYIYIYAAVVQLGAWEPGSLARPQQHMMFNLYKTNMPWCSSRTGSILPTAPR